MKKLTLIAASALVIVACKKKVETTTAANDPYATQKTFLKTTYANLAFAMYGDALTTAQDLNNALATLADNPSAQALTDAKSAWLTAREAYGQTEIFRFVDGPIDNPSDGPEGLINAWPMDESYIDYTVSNSTSGMINNPAISIDAETIINANEFGGETNISAGYHAIEFLLWGQDLSTTSAGMRPFTDYSTLSNADRRGEYLKIIGTLLVNALDQVKDQWDPAISGNYRVTWLAMNNDTALRKMFNSLRVLSGEELRGERIQVAYDSEDQEDEHSCFSDNTHRDIALNADGIAALYTGSYTNYLGSTVDYGYSISDLVGEKNASLNTTILARLALTSTAIGQMHVPFDVAIKDYKPGVLAVINSLAEEAEDFTDAAAAFNIVF